ncbi:hypothetical protein NDU88_003821 [Pleurodeles waltl]|uniref:Uncharacterized protein n=1 Tax=Pleurodeles waltl TaxID=8319 RepID=A0AAV7LJZ2_PLEWA|nr:hypothetical protein NDU88_003821 [Pleurodeles waltl]
MSKAERAQSKLRFEWHKSHKAREGRHDEAGCTSGDHDFESEPDLKQILIVMPHSLITIDGKIDALSYRMDRMTERLDKHAERLDTADHRISDVENELAKMVAAESKLMAWSLVLAVQVWETFEMYIHGVTITKHAGVLKSLRGSLARLEKEIVQLEGEHRNSGDARLLGLIHTKLTEFREIAQTKLQYMGKYDMAHTYRVRDHPGATLAALLHTSGEADMILEIQDEGGKMLQDPDAIARRFRHYYATLYNS